MKITSTDFKDQIPTKFTCDGDDIPPNLNVHDIPTNAKTLALIMDDPDAPAGTWVHWVVWNMPIETPLTRGTEGLNSWNKKEYGGPCPPSGTHHYHFKLYALDTELDLPDETTKEQLLQAMQGHIVEQSELIGTYSR